MRDLTFDGTEIGWERRRHLTEEQGGTGGTSFTSKLAAFLFVLYGKRGEQPTRSCYWA